MLDWQMRDRISILLVVQEQDRAGDVFIELPHAVPSAEFLPRGRREGKRQGHEGGTPLIVCDLCKRIPMQGKHEPFLYEIVTLKAEDTKTGRKGVAAGREIIRIQLHLCDACISTLNADLGRFIQSKKDTPPMVTRQPVEPREIVENIAGRAFGSDSDLEAR